MKKSCPFRTNTVCVDDCQFYAGGSPYNRCYIAMAFERIVNFNITHDDTHMTSNVAKILEHMTNTCEYNQDSATH